MGYRIEHWNEVSHIIEDGPTPEGRLLCSFIGDDHIQKSDRVVGLLRGQPAQPAGPTVRVKVAVETNADGEFAVVGWGNESYAAPSRVHAEWVMSIIEANVPIPQRVEPAVVEGTAVG